MLDPDAGPPELAWRQSLYGGSGAPRNIDEAANKFFGLMTIGDDRAIDVTYILGNIVYKKGAKAVPSAGQD